MKRTQLAPLRKATWLGQNINNIPALDLPDIAAGLLCLVMASQYYFTPYYTQYLQPRVSHTYKPRQQTIITEAYRCPNTAYIYRTSLCPFAITDLALIKPN